MGKDLPKRISAYLLIGACCYMLANSAAKVANDRMTYPPQGVRPQDFRQKTAELYEKKAYDACGPGTWENCIANYNIAIRTGKADRISYFNRALAYSKLGKYEEAVADYTRSLDLKKDPITYAARGINLLRLRRREEALSDFDNSIALDPSRTETYLLRGHAHYLRNEFPAALADYSKACSLGDTRACAELEKGDVFTWLYLDKQGNGPFITPAQTLSEIVSAVPAETGKFVLIKHLEYTGERRPIPEGRKNLIRDWAGKAGVGIAGFFDDEINFSGEGRKIWIPVQKQLFEGGLSKLPAGETTNLIAVYFRRNGEDIFLAMKNVPGESSSAPAQKLSIADTGADWD